MNSMTIPAEIIEAEPAAEAEQRLLDFVEKLILDVARNHPRMTQWQVALWLARVVVGGKR